jgi:hypothetical protein
MLPPAINDDAQRHLRKHLSGTPICRRIDDAWQESGESNSATLCADLYMPSTVHTIRFTGLALNQISEMPCAANCLRANVNSAKPLQPAVDFYSKVGSGNRLWRRS